MLGRRGFALESAARGCAAKQERWCPTNVFLRNLDLMGVRVQDELRIEVIGEGLPVFHGGSVGD